MSEYEGPVKFPLYAVVGLSTHDIHGDTKSVPITGWEFNRKTAEARVQKDSTWKSGAVIAYEFDSAHVARILTEALKK